MTLACVLFDFDGVLADYDKHVRVEHLAQAIGRTPERVQHAIYGSGIEEAADAGILSEAAYLDALTAKLDAPVLVEDWVSARRAATRLRPDVLALARQLAERTRVGILTNNGSLMARTMGDIAPGLFPLFAGRCHASASFGAAKPDPAVYRACVRALGVGASDTLFVDDNTGNVEGARRAGLMAHHYQNLPTFLHALAAYDLP